MRSSRRFACCLLSIQWVLPLAGWLLASADPARGQSELREPVYRVANEPGAPVQLAAAPVPMRDTAKLPFDFTQQPNEHPLGPAIRVAKDVLAHVDRDVRDYTCLLEKRERIDGQLGEKQVISMKVGHQPFSVYMYFNQPFQGREVLFVDGRNNNEMLVLECGFKRRLGQMQINPKGWLAMRGQKYPITKVGIRNLLAELIAVAEADTQFAECQVTTDPNKAIDGRPTTMIQIEHPVPRREFRAYVSRIFLDNELRVPIHYDAYMWPEAQGQAPPLEESYTYRNLSINSGLTANDFDPANGQIFKP